jgi:hypothetical protein
MPESLRVVVVAKMLGGWNVRGDSGPDKRLCGKGSITTMSGPRGWARTRRGSVSTAKSRPHQPHTPQDIHYPSCRDTGSTLTVCHYGDAASSGTQHSFAHIHALGRYGTRPSETWTTTDRYTGNTCNHNPPWTRCEASTSRCPRQGGNLTFTSPSRTPHSS